MGNFTDWGLATFLYLITSIITFLPVLSAFLKKVKLNPGGDSFMQSPHFSDENKLILQQHFTRINGTLLFWKNKAEWYKRFHFYTICWTIPISILIPIVTQYVNTDSHSKLFLTVISVHTAILIAFHRALKVENNYKAFRHGESDFYDIYRRMLDRPKSFGETESEQIENYFIDVEKIRKTVRISETDNLPILDEVDKKKNY